MSSWCADASAVGADSVDVYCEKDGFSEDEARWILSAGRRSGLLPRMHACGNSRTGAALLAAELGCASADMLHEASEEDVAALAGAGVAAVVCPASALQARARPPVRSLLDEGVTVALASGHTPGRNGVTSMALVISLAVSYFGMSVEEALRAATIGGAHALRAPAGVRWCAAASPTWCCGTPITRARFVWSFDLQPRRVWLGGQPVAA